MQKKEEKEKEKEKEGIVKKRCEEKVSSKVIYT